MIEVDVGAILYNIQTLRQMLGGVKLCCVVKGDGYGCGDVRMSRVLEEYACVDMLAVAMLDEALHLRSEPQEPAYAPSRPIEVGDLVELPGVKMAASVLALSLIHI